INVARPFIFSTAPPPPIVAAAVAALEILEANPHRVERLQANARVLRDALAAEGLPLGPSETQIVPLMVGDPEATVRLCDLVLERGIFAQGIRPPTVPEGTSRLRLATMATHRSAELARAARVIGNAARETGLLTGPAPELVQEWDEEQWVEPQRREATPWLEEAA
ncbi:MAG: aminotransferase class I/II-fold pyridoxal phosphate-dependent enzyme, partial [Solirubrobacterales bacterium]